MLTQKKNYFGKEKRNYRGITIWTIIVMLLATSNGFADLSIGYWDFEDVVKPMEFTGNGVVISSGGFSSDGFGGYFLWSNGPHIILTLTDLPAHDSIDLNFLFAVINTWDGSSGWGGTVYPDYFNVSVGGVLIFRETFDFRQLGDQTYTPPTGVLLASRPNTYESAAYNMGLDPIFDGIVHTDSTLTIEWWADGSGWQGTDPTIPYVDESFAIDNIEIVLNGVSTIKISVDIKPGSCPNPLNVKDKGVLPVAILGTEDFDVFTIDSASIRLAGVAPIRSGYEDVATHVVNSSDACECTTEGPDGYMDLTLKFNIQEIVSTLGAIYDGDILELTLNGVNLDGTPIEGSDCIEIIAKDNK